MVVVVVVQAMEILAGIRVAASLRIIFNLSMLISETKLKQKIITIKQIFCFSHPMFKI